MADTKPNSFFESIGSILSSKKYWYAPEKEKEYAPIGVLIGISQHLDSIFYVNEVNMWWQQLSPKMHYDYLFHSIKKMHRKFGKWSKKIGDEDVDAIMQAYQVNRNKAIDIFKLLNEEDLKEIKQYVGPL